MAAAAVCGLGAAASIPVAVAAGGRNRIATSDVTRSIRASSSPNLGPTGGQSVDGQGASGNLRWQSAEQLHDGDRKLSRGAKGRDRWRAQNAAVKAASISEDQFEAEVLESSIPVLVDFWASWCGPCRLMGISLDWAAQKYSGKIKCVKIDTDKSEKLVAKFAVYGLPTLILFSDGEAVVNTKREGALNKEKLQAYIEEYLASLAPAS